MIPCSWPCTKLGVHFEGGYWHCDEHLVEHRAVVRDEQPVVVAQKPPAQRPDLKPCGTWAAYQRHKRYGETPDAACLEACRTRAREQAARRRESAGVDKRRIPRLDAPAIVARYQQGESARSICDDLGVGYRRIRDLLVAQDVTLRPRQLQPCGTHAAYVRHLRHHERACDACLAAEVTHRTKYARSTPKKAA